MKNQVGMWLMLCTIICSQPMVTGERDQSLNIARFRSTRLVLLIGRNYKPRSNRPKTKRNNKNCRDMTRLQKIVIVGGRLIRKL